jgi:hypothetical protein
MAKVGDNYFQVSLCYRIKRSFNVKCKKKRTKSYLLELNQIKLLQARDLLETLHTHTPTVLRTFYDIILREAYI